MRNRDPHLNREFMSVHTRQLLPHTMPGAIRDIAEHRAQMVEKILEGTGISNPRVQKLADGLAAEIRKAADKAARAVEARLARADHLEGISA